MSLSQLHFNAFMCVWTLSKRIQANCSVISVEHTLTIFVCLYINIFPFHLGTSRNIKIYSRSFWSITINLHMQHLINDDSGKTLRNMTPVCSLITKKEHTLFTNSTESVSLLRAIQVVNNVLLDKQPQSHEN